MAPADENARATGSESIAARSIICRIECASLFSGVVVARPESREAPVFRIVGGMLLWKMTTMISVRLPGP